MNNADKNSVQQKMRNGGKAVHLFLGTQQYLGL